MTPDASIVIPSRAGRSRLPRLLAALAAQTATGWEAIVVVDGDVDGSTELLDNWPDPRVRAITFPENRGRAAALNAGFGAATADVLIRCDDDLEPPPHWLAGHLAAHHDGRIGAAGIVRNVLPETAFSRVYGEDATDAVRAHAIGADPDSSWRHWGGNVSIDRAAWDEVGRYDETTFRAYGWEDVDYGYRLHAAGIPVRVLPALEVSHHAAAVTTVIRATRALYSGAACRRFDDKHGTDTPGPSGHGAWDRTVALVARRITERRLTRAAATVDRALVVVPKSVGRKLVALLVEAAFRSGYRHPESVGSAI